jgi:hypothetical protein
MHGLLSLQPNVLECCALFYCFLRGGLPLVIGGFFKLIASLALACLLAFVVVHSAGIRKLVSPVSMRFQSLSFRLSSSNDGYDDRK